MSVFSSLYSAQNLETALRQVFGNYRSILDCSEATAMGTRIGLTVTTTRGAHPCIFTNYNGTGNPRNGGKLC